MRDHLPLVLTDFRGTFDRGEDDTVPMGFFMSSQNVRFLKGGVTTRYGSSLSLTTASVRRMAIYKRIGEVQRLLILDNAGHIYDSTNLGIPILTIAAMTDFSMATIFNRAYITPHNGITGLPGEKVYVYDGSGAARPAGGTPPSASTLTLAESVLSGSIELGTHAYGVAFESASGFLSAPGNFNIFTSLGSKKLDVSNIPLGPSGTVARYLVASKIITTFNGDFASQTYYLVPNGRIANNTATTLTIDFFDAALVSDVSYLLEQLSTIPAGVGISFYRARMLVWGEDANSSVVRVSKPGEPESFNSVEGFCTVNPGDSGGGVKNCAEYRNQLIICKSQRTYVTQDTGDEAAFWEVGSIDMSVGTECHGFGKSLDFGESMQDTLFVSDRAGMRLFVGTFSDDNIITNNIEDIWGRINKAAFHTIEVAVDSINFFIYAAVPLDDAVLPNAILFGDYSEGLSSDSIRWTTWMFPVAPQTVVVDVVAAVPVPKFGAIAGNIYKIDSAVLLDFGTAIDHWIEFPFFPEGADDTINHYTGIRMRIRGEGSLQITCKSMDSVSTLTAQQLVLSQSPGRPMFKGFNFTSERCSVKLRLNLASEHFLLTKLALMIAPIWEERASID